MKQFIRTTFLLMAFFLPTIATAFDFEVNGIHYNIINGGVAVTYCLNNGVNSYSGEVVIPESVTYNGTSYPVTAIGIDGEGYAISGAFENCTELKSVVLPNSITKIAVGAFSGCSGLTSIVIPNSVDSISEVAFSGCSGLTSIEIPNSVTSIGKCVFSYCTNLTSITVDIGNQIYDSRNNCNAIIETLTNNLISCCKNTVIPNSVITIGEYAFASCTDLTNIEIPNSVTTIGDYAFFYCTGLNNIEIPNSVTTIGDYAFYNCTGLNNIEIPNSVTTIGEHAFDNCTGLNILTIGNSVSSIGNFAFNQCNNLISVNLPNSVTNIGAQAFYGCSKLTDLTIGNSVTIIGYEAFGATAWYNNQPDGLVYAGLVAYKYKGTMNTNTSLTLKSGTKGIASQAFSNCRNLTSIGIPSSVTTIGSYAFINCTGSLVSH